MNPKDPAEFFWKVAETMLSEPGINRGTMMGFPCLRLEKEFFASAEHKTGDLIVKLPAERVLEIIASGLGQPFAPAGRTFKEWVLIPDRDASTWTRLMQEARDFVAA